MCKKCRDVSRSAWHNIKKLNTHCDCRDAKEAQMGRMLSYVGRYLKELSVTEPCTSKVIMPVIKRNCYNIEKLAVSFEHSREEDFVGAFENMKKLKCLEITTKSEDNLPVNARARILKSAHAGIEEIALVQDPIIAQAPMILLDLPVVSFLNILNQAILIFTFIYIYYTGEFINYRCWRDLTIFVD